jgi:two-component system chemotaxis response regulator CheY
MKRVLVVDDALTVRLFHRQLLEAAGFAVVEASNGVEALEQGLAQPFDLFVIDINMPKMDGLRLLSEMSRDEALCAVPVIVVSTEAQEHDQELAFLAGANSYLVKPADSARLQTQAKLLAGLTP